jgi:hypothetical protein
MDEKKIIMVIKTGLVCYPWLFRFLEYLHLLGIYRTNDMSMVKPAKKLIEYRQLFKSHPLLNNVFCSSHKSFGLVPCCATEVFPQQFCDHVSGVIVKYIP